MKLNIFISAVTLLLLAALSFNAHGQNLQGKVVDENDEPLAYANVMLQKADSAYLSGAMTDTLGMFTMPAHPDGKMLHVSFIGYESYHAPINGTDFGTIRMIPDTELLGKAVVKGYLPKTVIKGDAFVTPVENSVLAEAGSANDVLEKIRSIDLNFLGINLGEMPTMALNVLILIPIISGLTSLLISFVSMKNVKNQSPEQQQAAGMTKGMMFMMPLLSVFISFSVPAGVGIYWIYSNVISVVQTLLLNKYLNPQKLAAEEMALEEQKREEERQAHILKKKQKPTM